MDNNFNPRTVKEFLYEMIKDLKWHQRLYLKIYYRADCLWTKILCNTVYKKYNVKL